MPMNRFTAYRAATGVFLPLLILVHMVCAATVPHPLPPGAAPAVDYTIEVNGVPVPVVEWYGNFAYAHASVDPDAMHTVRVTATEPVTDYRVSPLRDDYAVTLEGTEASFEVAGRAYLRVRLNALKTLFVFLDPHEIDPPDPDDVHVVDILDYVLDATGSQVETDAINQALLDVSADPAKNVLYFPPGLYRAGTIELQSNVTLYLAPGALILASDDPTHFHRDAPGGTYRRLNFITGYQVENVTIRGRGVIDGNGNYLRTVLPDLPSYTVVGRPGTIDSNRIVNLQFSHAENIRVEGVYSRNSSSWNTIPHYCTDIEFRNYKVLSDMIWTAYKNEDAIDPDSCVGLTIEDSFFLARDDGIVLKTTGTYNGQRISPDGTSRDMHDVVIRNNVIWCETAAIKYGYNESEASEIYNLLVEDNVILMARDGVQLRTVGPGFVRDAVFRRNHYEAYQNFNLTSRNYWLDDSNARDIQFYDETHAMFGSSDSVIKGTRISFHNITIGGVLHGSMESARFQNQGTEITFTNDYSGREYIIDDGESGYAESGAWFTSTGRSEQRYGPTYRVSEDPTGGPDAADTWATWTPPLTGPEKVEVYLLWSDYPNRPSAAPVEIHHANGVEQLTVNQQIDGGQWNYLGTFDFEPGGFIKLLATDPGYTIADAARFVVVDLPADQAFDLWLQQHFEDGADPDVDAVIKDGRTVTLREAFLLGEDPHDPHDALRLGILSDDAEEGASEMRLRFRGLENRVYQIEASPDLAFWSALGDHHTGTGDWIEHRITPAPEDSKRFFRVSAQLPNQE